MKTIVIDSGSTKADVADFSMEGTPIYSVPGMNPTTRSSYVLDEKLASMFSKAEEIYIYGAGIYDETAATIYKRWFSLPDETRIYAYSDMLGACRASAGDTEGIISILGTGSNSCVYDGKNMVEQVPSLGYIIGDEGGGTHIGKLILRDYIYDRMPKEVRTLIESKYAIDRASILDGLYNNSEPNRYLAQYAQVLVHVDNSWKKSLLDRAFTEFIETRICAYNGYQKLPLHFVGSIAYHFQPFMDLALAKYNLKAASYLKKPIHALIKYHQHAQ